MIAGIVLFATAAEEIVGHPGDALEGFTRLLLALSIGLVMLAQVGTVKRVGGPLLVERIGVAVIVAALMLPALEVRANLMFFTVVLVLTAALVLERRRDPMQPADHSLG